MRTTLDLDPDVLAAATACYPPGTPKTVVVEEGLRLIARRGVRRSERPLRELGFFGHLPVGIHEDFDAPLDGESLELWGALR